MKKIIFDSSTAILLAKINLLRTISEKIEIIFPEKIKKETTEKKENFDSKMINRLIKENKIHTEKADKEKTMQIMESFNIDKGEAEALELAIKKNIGIATDDGPTIKTCKILNTNFITALNFLTILYEKKQISKELALEKLKILERYGRYNNEILKDAKEKIGGKK